MIRLSITVSLFLAAFSSASERPNIIYILADDLGYGDLGCYGQETLETPNLDQMAKEGLLFTRHYAGSTVCAPSRCVLMTGLHTGHCSVRGNGPARLQETTVADILRANGYKTACVGKWGIGHPPPLDDPNQHGFDHFYGYVNMFHAHNFFPPFLVRDGEKELLRNTQMDAFRENPKEKEGRGVAEEAIDYAPELITQEALKFVRENRDNPFFLYYALNIPHANNEGGRYDRGMEVDDLGPFENKRWPLAEKGFAAMMRRIDGDVGRLRSLLKDLGIDQNTMILFSSDNGPHEEGGHSADFFDSNGIRRGVKRDLYEGGVRVPFIVHWPAVIRKARTLDDITAFQDFMPTICDLLGVESPPTDGLSLLPLIRDENWKSRDRILYWEFGERGGKQSVLQGDWKLIRLGLENPSYELYNVVDDPSEEFDRSTEFPEKVSHFKALLRSIPDERSLFKP